MKAAQHDATGGRSHAVVTAEAITVRFGGVIAVSEVSLAVPAGEIRGIIGPNGAGKTTLFDVVTGIRRPTSGAVRLRGADVTDRPAVWRSRNGMRRTFQRQQPFGWLSVEDNVLTALDHHGGGGGILADLTAAPARRRRERDRRDRARRALERCGLAEFAATPAGGLPIGRIRLLELARAIVDDPIVLLLDEPTSGLDEREAARFADVVRDVRDSTGCAVLLVEHDVPFVMSLCDRITVLDLGVVIAEGTPAEVAADTAVRTAYLG